MARRSDWLPSAPLRGSKVARAHRVLGGSLPRIRLRLVTLLRIRRTSPNHRIVHLHFGGK